MKVMFDTTDDNDLIVKMLKLDENLVKEPLGIKSYNVFSKRVKATIFFEKMETEADKVLKETQIAALKASIARREKLLANENYVAKAPKNIVDMDREKLKEEKEKLALLEKQRVTSFSFKNIYLIIIILDLVIQKKIIIKLSKLLECADNGHITATYDLGANFYFNGKGTDVNYELADYYLNIAKVNGLKKLKIYMS